MSEARGPDVWDDLIEATKQFLDAFVSWEAETHLDFGGGKKTTVRPGESIGDSVVRLIPTKDEFQKHDELRDLLRQAAHRLASRGFTGRDRESRLLSFQVGRGEDPDSVVLQFLEDTSTTGVVDRRTYLLSPEQGREFYDLLKEAVRGHPSP